MLYNFEFVFDGEGGTVTYLLEDDSLMPVPSKATPTRFFKVARDRKGDSELPEDDGVAT